VLGHQRRPGDHRADRVRDHRAGMVEGWVTGTGENAERYRRVAVVGSGPSGLAAAQQLVPGRPRRGRLRTGRAAWRAPPLRDPRIQDGEGGPRPAPRPAGGRGRRVPVRGLGGGERSRGEPGSGRRRHRSRRTLAGRGVRRRGAGRGCDTAARPGGAGSRPGGHPSRHGLPEAVEHGPGGDTHQLADLRTREARGDHRGW
jgi:hypothetical protein